MRSYVRILVPGLLVALALSAPVHATFHFARIAEVYTGNAAQPNAQYVIIVAHSNLQNQFAGVEVEVYSATGAPMALTMTAARATCVSIRKSPR